MGLLMNYPLGNSEVNINPQRGQCSRCNIFNTETTIEILKIIECVLRKSIHVEFACLVADTCTVQLADCLCHCMLS